MKAKRLGAISLEITTEEAKELRDVIGSTDHNERKELFGKLNVDAEAKDVFARIYSALEGTIEGD